MRQIATFQTQATGTSYRLCFHVASTSASAYTIAVDNVVVGPQTQLYGAPVTDWVDYTPTGTWLVNTSYYGKWRRVGDSMEVDIYVVTSGAPTATSLEVSMPSGYSIDLNKIVGATGVSLRNNLGTFTIFDNGGSPSGHIGMVVGSSTYPTTAFRFISETGAQVTSTSPFTWGASDSIKATIKIPISGWSSTVQMSNDTDTRVVAFNAGKTAAQNITLLNTFETILFDANVVDTHGTYNSATGTYTIPVSGYYHLSLGLIIQGATAGDDIYSRITYTGGTITKIWDADGTGSFPLESSGVVYLNAGDSVRGTFKNATGIRGNIIAGAGDYNVFSIRRLSGPATIASSETVAVKATTSTTSVTTTATTPAIFSVKDYDTHGIYSTSTGIATVPISGKWRISATITSGAAAVAFAATNRAVSIRVVKNGVAADIIQTFTSQVVGTWTVSIGGTTVLNLSAGDQISINCSHGTSVTDFNLSGTADGNHFEMERIGS
jgi:hypothetical protein